MDALRELMEEGGPVSVFDIRPEAEFSEWRIPGSRHLPVERSDGGLRARERPDLPGGGPVVVVCQRGMTSRLVVRDLRDRWGVDALSLRGGMGAWSATWNTAPVPDPEGRVEIVQLRRTGKGCLSYLAAGGGEAVVVDPSLDPAVYVDEARRRGWRIAHVLDTHVHADHVSRARVLAGAAGAALHLPRQDRVRFPHDPLEEGDGISIGELRLEALDTPGHTGESLSFLLDGRFLFTGDTLFLESVGRPDLESAGGRDDLRERARALHRS